MSLRLRFRRCSVLTLGLALGLAVSIAAEANSKLRHPLSAGAVHPSFFEAAEVNPAALVNDKVTAVQDIFGPPLLNRSNYANRAALATSDGKWGLGASYDFATAIGGVGDATHSMAAGLAFKVGDVSGGVGFTSPLVTQDFDPDIKLGLMGGVTGSLHYTLVLDHLTSGSPQPLLGIGFEKENQYNLEFSLELPSFSSIAYTYSMYTVLLGASAYAGNFGVAFEAAYPFSLDGATGFTVTQSLSVLAWFAKNWNLSIHVDSSSYVSFGLAGIL